MQFKGIKIKSSIDCTIHSNTVSGYSLAGVEIKGSIPFVFTDCVFNCGISSSEECRLTTMLEF
jgi:parallel beta-helix repeat protein